MSDSDSEPRKRARASSYPTTLDASWREGSCLYFSDVAGLLSVPAAPSFQLPPSGGSYLPTERAGLWQLTAGTASLIAANVLLTAGNAPLTAGNVSPLRAGNAPLTAGSVWPLTAGNAPLIAGSVSPLTAGHTPLTAGSVWRPTAGNGPLTAGIESPLTAGNAPLTAGGVSPLTAGNARLTAASWSDWILQGASAATSAPISTVSFGGGPSCVPAPGGGGFVPPPTVLATAESAPAALLREYNAAGGVLLGRQESADVGRSLVADLIPILRDPLGRTTEPPPEDVDDDDFMDVLLSDEDEKEEPVLTWASATSQPEWASATSQQDSSGALRPTVVQHPVTAPQERRADLDPPMTSYGELEKLVSAIQALLPLCTPRGSSATPQTAAFSALSALFSRLAAALADTRHQDPVTSADVSSDVASLKAENEHLQRKLELRERQIRELQEQIGAMVARDPGALDLTSIGRTFQARPDVDGYL